MNNLIEAMLRNRGITTEQFAEMNSAPHELPSGIPELCERLDNYRRTKELVVVLTDFDMDGIMTGVIGFAGLSELGFHVALFCPDTEKYGIAPNEIDRLVEQYPNAKCILTGDIGIGEFETLDHAVSDYGLEVLLTDHHVPSDRGIPACSVVVDPMCDQDDKHFGFISGAHVVYLVLRYYAEYVYPKIPAAVAQIDRLRVFAGISTMTDVMPLMYENRAIVREALAACRTIYKNDRATANAIPGCEMYRRAFDGLYLLVSKVHEANSLSFFNEEVFYEDFFSYYAGPTFNSIKRLHERVHYAYDVFFGERGSAENSMYAILNMNRRRRELEKRALEAIRGGEFDQSWEPYIYLTDVGSGIRGLLAQDFREETDGPVLVVAREEDGTYSGSGRSPDWFPFLTETKDLAGVHPAGHEGAFGIILDDDAACDALVKFLQSRVDEIRPSEKEWQPDFVLSTCSADADSDVRIEVLEEYIRELENYRPFGAGFEKPEGVLEFNPREVSWNYFGKGQNENKHVKASIARGVDLICFFQGEYFPNGFNVSKMPEITRVRGEVKLNLYRRNDDPEIYRTIQFYGTLGTDMDQSI